MDEIRIPSLTRDKLASFLPTHELIKAFETLFSAASQMASGIEDAQTTADLAQATGAASLALVTALADVVEAINQQGAQTEQLRAELASISSRIDGLEIIALGAPAQMAQPDVDAQHIEQLRAELAGARRDLQQLTEGYLS